MSIDYVIERAVANARERLGARGVDGLVYAVAFFGADTEALFADEITVGLERDRVGALQSHDPYDAFWHIWNADRFALTCPDRPNLLEDDEFLAAQQALWESPDFTWEALGDDPQRYALNRVAAQVASQHPLPAVTDDFVVYLFAEDFGDELVANIEFAASAGVAERLRAKGLMPAPPPP